MASFSPTGGHIDDVRVPIRPSSEDSTSAHNARSIKRAMSLPAALVEPENEDEVDEEAGTFGRVTSYCDLARAWAENNPATLKVIAVIVLLVGGVLLLFHFLPIVSWMKSAQTYMNENRGTSALILFVSIVVGCSCFAPIALIETFGIYVFGWQVGIPLTFSAAVLGNILVYFAAKYCCHAKARELVMSFGHGSLVFENMIQRHPWKMTMLIRYATIFL
jgi:hypothetical protein